MVRTQLAFKAKMWLGTQAGLDLLGDRGEHLLEVLVRLARQLELHVRHLGAHIIIETTHLP